MNITTFHFARFQRGAGILALTGILLIVGGLAGLIFASFPLGRTSPDNAITVPSESATVSGPVVVQPATPTATIAVTIPVILSSPATAPVIPTVVLHPNWFGVWLGAMPDSKMVITAAGIEIYALHGNNGKVRDAPEVFKWGDAKEPNGNEMASGYAKSSVSLAEVAHAYEEAVSRFQRNPIALHISDPVQSRKLIRQIRPANYRVVWVSRGGDCGQRNMIVDGDLILSIVSCEHEHTVNLFTRFRP
jgi:hypothetical protein